MGTDRALLLLGRNLENLDVAVNAVVIGHSWRSLVKQGFGVVAGAPVGFVALGLAKAMVGHVVFGAPDGVMPVALRWAGFLGYLAEKR